MGQSATKDTILKDFRKPYLFMSKSWHPDKHVNSKATENFKRLNNAYDALNILLGKKDPAN